MYFPISSWAVAFAVTMAVEIPIVLSTVPRDSRDLVRLVVIVGCANLATHLAVWYVLTQLLLINTPGYVMAAEAWAVAVEAAVYWAAFRGSLGRPRNPHLPARERCVVRVRARAGLDLAGDLLMAPTLEWPG